MEWLMGILSSSGLGSIIGLAGGLITKKLELRAKKQELEFQIKMRDLDLREGEQERSHEIAMADKHMERAQVEGDIQIEAKEVEGFVESQKSNKVEGALRWVRPIITGYLLIMSSVLFVVVWIRVGGLENISKADLVDMLLLMINAVIFLTVTCVSWWFGSRGGNIGKKK